MKIERIARSVTPMSMEKPAKLYRLVSVGRYNFSNVARTNFHVDLKYTRRIFFKEITPEKFYFCDFLETLWRI